jgi:predicted molibdopterin-dependent oxidoreductase YjgC
VGLDRIGCLLVSGDDALDEPGLRALAARAESVIAISLYRKSVAGLVDLVLPATSYLERDGTLLNLEGRLQRLRRAVIPPAPDELAWIARLAERFGVELSPYPALVFEELYGFPYSEIGERAELRDRRTAPPAVAARHAPPRPTTGGGPLQLLRYRPLFSGSAVERVEELQFQRPPAEVELSREDARVRGIATGNTVRISSNGTARELRARINPRLIAGAVRVAEEHAEGLAGGVEVTKP